MKTFSIVDIKNRDVYVATNDNDPIEIYRMTLGHVHNGQKYILFIQDKYTTLTQTVIYRWELPDNIKRNFKNDSVQNIYQKIRKELLSRKVIEVNKTPIKLSGSGYPMFGLITDLDRDGIDYNTNNHVLVHRMIMYEFNNIWLSSNQVNHINGDIQNNISSNLEEMTEEDNIIESYIRRRGNSLKYMTEMIVNNSIGLQSVQRIFNRVKYMLEKYSSETEVVEINKSRYVPARLPYEKMETRFEKLHTLITSLRKQSHIKPNVVDGIAVPNNREFLINQEVKTQQMETPGVALPSRIKQETPNINEVVIEDPSILEYNLYSEIIKLLKIYRPSELVMGFDRYYSAEEVNKRNKVKARRHTRTTIK